MKSGKMNMVWRIYRGIIISDNCQESLLSAHIIYAVSAGNERNVSVRRDVRLQPKVKYEYLQHII